MGVLKLFEGTGDLECVVATIKTPEGSLQKVVDGSSFSIGRAPDCVLSIPHAGISRLHMLVTVKRGEVYIMDQESSNGTFLNGNKIESKKLTHVKPSDEIKLGLSEVILQFLVLEKHFKTDYIAESLLPSHEKDNLMALIKASNHKAQEIIASAQAQSDHITLVATEKIRNLENQTLLKQEEIISSAQVEAQHFVADAKRKAAQMILESEEKAKAAVAGIHEQADRIRKEAEIFFQNKVKESEVRGNEIIEQHTKIAHEVVEDLKAKTIRKAEEEVHLRMSSVVKEIEEKSNYLKGLQATCADYEINRKKEIDADLAKHREEALAQFEKERNEKFADLDAKIKTLETEYNNKTSEFEREYNSKKSQLESEYASKMSKLEGDYASRSDLLESQHTARSLEVERQFQKLNEDLETQHRKNIDEAGASLVKQKQMLDAEVQSQRQELVKLTSEISASNQKYTDVKTKYEEIKGLLKGLQNSEADLIKSLSEKRDQIKVTEADLQMIRSDLEAQQEKFVTLKNSTEAQIEDYQQRLSKLKVAFEGESQRLKKESEQELEAYKEEFKKQKDIIDQQLKVEKGDIHKKTMDYMDSERARMDEYRSQMLREKKELDQQFDKTKKEFEAKTKEVIELEKEKVEEARQNFINNLNRERQIITDDVTIAIMKIKNQETLTATSIAEAVARVFNSHVTTHSVDSTIKSSKENVTQLKFQFMSYGLGIALAAFMAFKFLIQPQINRHIAGTDEHSAAQIPVERAKYTAPQSLEYKDTYTDLSLYTQNFSSIFLDEQIHDKWFKHISGYMYETWRVDETKSIEVISISTTLVKSLQTSAANLDAEFYQKGIDKMRELEAESEKRMVEILGTKVKYEAFRRKEREFFEPYVQNQ